MNPGTACLRFSLLSSSLLPSPVKRVNRGEKLAASRSCSAAALAALLSENVTDSFGRLLSPQGPLTYFIRVQTSLDFEMLVIGLLMFVNWLYSLTQGKLAQSTLK